jgi:hypothetical protein
LCGHLYTTTHVIFQTLITCKTTVDVFILLKGKLTCVTDRLTMESFDRAWTKVVLNVPLPGDTIPRWIWGGFIGPMPSPPPNPQPPQRLICCIEASRKLSASDLRMMISGDPVTVSDEPVSVPRKQRSPVPTWNFGPVPYIYNTYPPTEVLDRYFWADVRRRLSLPPARPFLDLFDRVVDVYDGRDDNDNHGEEANDENSEDTSEDSDTDSEDEMKCEEDC